METNDTDILLLSAGWPSRALVRAELLEERFDVVAVDTWPSARSWMLGGGRPRLVVLDLVGMPEPEAVLRELRALADVTPVYVILGAGTVSADSVEACGFRVLRRPIQASALVAEVRRVLLRGSAGGGPSGELS